jgi:cytochrome P450
MEEAFDRFVDVRGRPTDAIVRSMREMEVDIAVDLMGYTQDCRPEIFVGRTARIQVSYLGFGFPGPGRAGEHGLPDRRPVDRRRRAADQGHGEKATCTATACARSRPRPQPGPAAACPTRPSCSAAS